MRKITIFQLIFWPLTLLILTTSCGRERDNGGKMVFVYNEAAGISSLDPLNARNQENIWAMDQLYSKLFRLNDTLGLEGDLAASWTFQDSGWSVMLKEGVLWHGSEREVEADDVVFSLERLRNPANSSAGAWVLDQVEQGGIVARSKREVFLRTKRFHPAFLSLLSMTYTAVLPQHLLAEQGEAFFDHPIGSGPFQYFDWRRNTALLFHKNPHYFERDEQGVSLPYLDAVVVRFVRDNMAVMREMQKGEMHLISGLSSDLYNWAKKDSNLRLMVSPYLKTDYIGFNLESEKAILRNPDFRKALNLGLDKSKMVAFLKGGIGEVANYNPVPSSLYAGTEQHQYNLEKARALLEGIPKADRDEEIELATTAGYTQLCEWIQGQWQQLGVRVKVNVLPTSVHRKRVSEGDVDLFRKSWIADYPHAENFLMLFESSQKAPAGPNYTRFEDAQFDTEYGAFFDPDLPAKLPAMDSILKANTPMIPLFYDQVTRCVAKDVKGMKVNALNNLNLMRVKV